MTKINSANDPMVNLEKDNVHSKTLSKKRSKSALWAFLGFLGFILLLWLGVSLLSSLLHDPVASDTGTAPTDVTTSTAPVANQATTDTTDTTVNSDNAAANQNSNVVPLVEVKPAPTASSVNIIDPNAKPESVNIDPNAAPAPVNTEATTTTDANTATPAAS